MDDGVASLQSFVKEQYGYSNEDHLKSKIEVIMWYCLYQQYPVLRHFTEKKTDVYEEIRSLLNNGEKNANQDSEQNLQLLFLQGLVHFRKGEYQQTVDIFEKLIDPRNKITQYIRLGTIGLKTRYTLANCYMSLAQYEKAEVILKSLHDVLEAARKSRNGKKGGLDADKEPRVEIDLAYCYMQRGAYKSAFQIYKELYDNNETGDFEFDLRQIKRERRIMGLSNYAAGSILFIIMKKTVLTMN